MSNLFDKLSDEEKKTAEAFATEKKVSKEIAAIIIKSGEEDREEALKVFQAAATKSKPKAMAAEERINKLQKDYEALDKKYQEAKKQPISALSKSLVSYQNDLHKMRMEIKQLEATL